MKNPKVFIVQSGFYFFGNEVKPENEGFIEFDEGAIFRNFGGGKGLPGVLRGDKKATVSLDRYIASERVLLPEENVIGIVDSINLYDFSGCTTTNDGLRGTCTHKMVALKGGFYFFGKLSSATDGYLKLTEAYMSGGFENNGISGQCSGNPTSKMTLDAFDKGQELQFRTDSCLAIMPSIDIAALKTTTLR